MMCNKYYLLIVVFFFLKSGTVMTQEVEKILWREELKLRWDDFKGKVPNYNIGFKKAITTSEIRIKADFLDGQMPNFIVGAYFIKNQSWTITNSDTILAHEQIHFDISELFARKIRRTFEKLQTSKEKDYDIYIAKYYDLRKQELNLQEDYDNKVLFNKERQLEWQARISKELQKLKDYEYNYNSEE